MAKEETRAADPAWIGGAHVHTDRPLCPGPRQQATFFPTSVTSFTDMSPERVFKGLISCGSNDRAFPPRPALCSGCTFSSLSRAQSGWPTPALPWVCLQGSLHSCRPLTSGLGISERRSWMAPRASPAPGVQGEGTESGLPRRLSGKESTCNAGDAGDSGSVSGSGRSPEGGNSNPLQSSCLENLMDKGAWRAINTVLGGHKVGPD